MTVRRLAALTLAAFALLLAAVAASATTEPGAGAGAAQVAAADAGAGMPVQADGVAISEATVDAAAPAPSTPAATPTPLPAITLQELVDIEPPALVEIPADLVSTPTPDAPTPVPLPFLTNIPTTPRDGGVVYLTFDDGPDPVYTNRILDTLARYQAKATFFLLGNSVDAHPGVVARIVAEGHALGNHTYYHEALPLEEAEYALQTLEATNGALARAVGRTTSCVRPPYGALDQPTFDLLRTNGYSVQMWEVDSEDYRLNDAYSIASVVLANTSLGDRVLLHDGPSNRAATATALESILDVLTTRGVQFHALSC